MAKDYPSWQRSEPMTAAEARQRTINYLRNSTPCCYSGPHEEEHRERYAIGECPKHTEAWIERETQARMDAANHWMGWSNRLGDLVRGQSAIRTGRMLADAGLRDETGNPSAAALEGDEPIAAWAEHHGYPVALWHVERVRELLASLAAIAA